MSFEVEPAETFDHRDALDRMLALLDAVIVEIWEHRRILFPRPFPMEEWRGLEFARQDIAELRRMVAIMDLSPEDLLEFGLIGERLRFKMLVIQTADQPRENLRNRSLERAVERNRGSRDWKLYRRAIEGTLSAIDGPLESLTKALGAKEAVVEFKKALEVLLRI